MKKTLIRLLAGIIMGTGSLAAGAATMNITASFTPSVSNPSSNTFTNTTPQSGYCSNWSSLCPSGTYSINTNLTLKSNGLPILASETDGRDHIYFKLPARKAVTVTNSSDGSESTVYFSFTNISARMYNVSNPGSGWTGGSFDYPDSSSGCSRQAAALGGGNWYHWAWKIKNPTSPAGCYKKRKTDYTWVSTAYMNQISVGYKLETPNPLKLTAGVYTGSVDYTVGPGDDVDFGNKWDASDSTLRVNFTLSVNHELKLSATADNQQVALQPCTSGKVCTAEDGAANWERWMINRITPEMTGRSNFSLSSSGAFTVYLKCEQQSGSDCALRSDNTPSQTVPVQSLLTLPNSIVDSSTGSAVSKRRLAVGRDLKKNVFITNSFGENQAGSIDFLVSKADVDTMLKTRPDTYRGAITVIFDPKIY